MWKNEKNKKFCEADTSEIVPLLTARFGFGGTAKDLAKFLPTKDELELLALLTEDVSAYDDCSIYCMSIPDCEPEDDQIYDYLKKTLQLLSDKSIWIKNEQDVLKLVRWIDMPEIDKNAKTIQFQTSAEVKPIIVALNSWIRGRNSLDGVCG